MQAAFGTADNLNTSSLINLPMLDMSPTEPTCMYSTPKYIADLSDKFGMVPICTFDQQLWWKALEVLNSPRCDIENFVIRLGEFHTRMNFLGCIGYIMANSGLSEIFELVYAGNTIPHLFSGKALDRAWRAHQLVDISLNTLLLKEILESEDLNTENLKDTIKHVLGGKADLSIVETEPDLLILTGKLECKKQMLKQNPTATFWLQYLDLIDIIKKQIQAERLGDWKLHMEVMKEMLPYFSACGHNNYTKPVWLYLQQRVFCRMNIQVYSMISRKDSMLFVVTNPEFGLGYLQIK